MALPGDEVGLDFFCFGLALLRLPRLLKMEELGAANPSMCHSACIETDSTTCHSPAIAFYSSSAVHRIVVSNACALEGPSGFKPMKSGFASI